MLNELSNASGLNKKMKTKKDCFKHFNHAKVILNKKKTSLQVMYVRDFREYFCM